MSLCSLLVQLFLRVHHTCILRLTGLWLFEFLLLLIDRPRLSQGLQLKRLIGLEVGAYDILVLLFVPPLIQGILRHSVQVLVGPCGPDRSLLILILKNPFGIISQHLFISRLAGQEFTHLICQRHPFLELTSQTCYYILRPLLDLPFQPYSNFLHHSLPQLNSTRHRSHGLHLGAHQRQTRFTSSQDALQVLRLKSLHLIKVLHHKRFFVLRLGQLVGQHVLLIPGHRARDELKRLFTISQVSEDLTRDLS
jgi:hypothetical protein